MTFEARSSFVLNLGQTGSKTSPALRPGDLLVAVHPSWTEAAVQ